MGKDYYWAFEFKVNISWLGFDTNDLFRFKYTTFWRESTYQFQIQYSSKGLHIVNKVFLS